MDRYICSHVGLYVPSKNPVNNGLEEVGEETWDSGFSLKLFPKREVKTMKEENVPGSL